MCNLLVLDRVKTMIDVLANTCEPIMSATIGIDASQCVTLGNDP